MRVLPGSNASLSGALAKHISQSGTEVENLTPLPLRGTAGVTPRAVGVGAATADDASGTTTSAEGVEEVDPVEVVTMGVEPLLLGVVVVCASPVDIVNAMRIAETMNRRAVIVAPPFNWGKSTRVVQEH